MFMYTQLSRRGLRLPLPLPRSPVAKLVLGVVALTLGIVVTALAVVAAAVFALLALGHAALRRLRRPAGGSSGSSTVSRRASQPPSPSATQTAEDVRFRELP